jgi:hypothetical protein
VITPTAPSDPIVRWCVLMLRASGCAEAVKVRSPSESLALETVQHWKPYHRVATAPAREPADRQRPGGAPPGQRYSAAARAGHGRWLAGQWGDRCPPAEVADQARHVGPLEPTRYEK